MALYIDKIMGGRARDKDEVNLIVDGDSDLIKQYIQDLFNNSTFNWSQITGDILSNQQLIDYLNSLIDQINQNTINNGDLITNELKAYVDNLFDNLTITWDQIIGSPEFNQEFKDYIQNLLDNLTITWEQIIGSPVLNQQLIDLLNQYKQDIENNFAEYVLGETVTNELKQYIDNLLNEIRNQLQEVINATTLNTTLLTDIQNQIDEINNLITTIQAGDEITQEYKDYLEQKFQDIQNQITEITEGAVITEEISNYIDNSLTELKEYLEEFVNNTVQNVVENYIEEIVQNITTGESTRLISGTITHVDFLDFLVSPLVYQILNNRYTSAQVTVTIPPNTDENPRFAVIYADVFGNVGYILGTAAENPAVPRVNDSTQILLTIVYIAALGTEPAPDPDPDPITGELVTTVIYDENIEWTTEKTQETGVVI
ncbi:MAG: hypothetical protein Q8J97_05830, partial [Flavobacteriaceae bacterium]|nr:hypothetical protein [Flavobacteriaceae bacterium]